ncbi:hypothetical protein GW943_02595 [Candidatus Parcubacteria bacterium]|uniref:Uncharacterized protein n=1 Tax=Candidatus Kaiserbacteria bacterium CG10_big_fil_rev_8_21_14_0_10_47_16 TaxID=1974608 RepID=A0A2H0UDH6_9BACT|nr:hypothetical protein [Candidatus Parcubacteria bacterium]PIR84474.1 MAG: hypothetical protein COU16_02750 [Candidatus Kaiserbacteria bacterium CG10_big_fil_rev_8_21_14_0_10_47_16]
MSPTLKKIAIGIAALIVIFYAYSFLFGGDDASSGVLTSETVSPETQQFLIRLNKLKAVEEADTSLFRDDRFLSLEDRRQTIEDEATGRTNPFAPVR